jgi:hypothetical protein
MCLFNMARGTTTRPKMRYERLVCVFRLCTGAVCVAPASANLRKGAEGNGGVETFLVAFFC